MASAAARLLRAYAAQVEALRRLPLGKPQKRAISVAAQTCREARALSNHDTFMALWGSAKHGLG